MNQDIRNVAIIAHVDHGKTTLVDSMLKQSGTFRSNQNISERAMDSNDLEKERGITILAKCTSIMWKNTKINIVDTPGHADFGGEVERILTMVDGVILLVDSSEGVMPQTKFVLDKALKIGLHPIVVINKIDRPDGRPQEVIDEVFDLFIALGATDEQAHFPIVYASGRSGWASMDLNSPRENIHALFDLILDHVPAPERHLNDPFKMLLTTREYDSYLGRILTGKIHSGTIKVNQNVKVLDRDGSLVENARITKLFSFHGLERIAVESASSGDIVILAGLSNATVSNTVCAPEITEALDSPPIDPPTISITFSVNDSPLAGREGSKVTSRVLEDRLAREVEGNVSIKVRQSSSRDSFEVSGRGELQLGVLIETMRREGFELSISRPKVLYKIDENDQRLEPMEEIQIDVDDIHVGTVVESLNLRKAEMLDMKPSGGGKTRVTFLGPSRGLIGYHGQFLTDTKGTGVMHRMFHSYGPYKGPIEGRRNGVLISTDNGQAVAYALWNLEERGKLFIKPGEQVYQGMIIGEHSRENDLEVNPLKAKQLTNVRSVTKDEAVRLTPPTVMTLEKAIAYIEDDEKVEVTPKSIRLRKAILDPNARKRAGKQG
ncbi:GTP-binding protein TypA [Candidatus Phycorickettsia trachydisci]|uniref:Large ribosomal subunit assembly factor BipA n=1 Tax=Candidatus Phycorickettsia trachydisci TaxID=2115978 RepID=A0A2P1P7Z2_9RICK|nr:translational GTPase TypA [Candidatus Phycorickettsia trachydisci]AVP87389.1 GTP-binding protein TypA [Candidatus Phycorickettsia trachydisci]